MDKKIIMVDIETTGFSPRSELIVEVGIVGLNLDTGEKKIIYSELVNEGIREEHRKSWIFENSDMKFEDVQKAGPLDKKYLQFIFNNYPASAFNKKFDFGFFKQRGLKINELECPMLLSTDICKLPGKRGGYKWPNVEEAHKHFYGDVGYVETHRGADDAFHEADIVLALYKEGIFKF